MTIRHGLQPDLKYRGLRGALRPWVREVSLFYYCWARRDLQRKNPHHPDLIEIIHRIRDLMAERESSNSIYRRVIQWL